MIRIRVYWDSDSETETAQRVTNAIDSIIEAKQKQLDIVRLDLRTHLERYSILEKQVNDPVKAMGIDIMRKQAKKP